MPFLSRLVWAWVCFFKVLFDGTFAAETKRLEAGPPPQKDPEKKEPAKEAPDKQEKKEPEKAAPKPAPPSTDAALQLLALMQREGRLVDFLEQDVASFSDADVGAAARVVHDGCRKALRAHATLAPIYADEEGAKVDVKDGYDARAVKLVGDPKGKGPWKGTLQHHGWRVEKLTLPEAAPGHDATVVAPAEVEVS